MKKQIKKTDNYYLVMAGVCIVIMFLIERYL